MPSDPGDNRPSTGTRTSQVARAGYEGYGGWLDWKTYDGRDMPQWDDLPVRIQMAWVAGIAAAVRKLSAPEGGG